MRLLVCICGALLAVTFLTTPASSQTPSDSTTPSAVPPSPSEATPVDTPTPDAATNTNTTDNGVPEPPLEPVILIGTIFAIGFFLSLTLPASLLIYATVSPLADSEKERAKILDKARKKSEKKDMKNIRKEAKLKAH